MAKEFNVAEASQKKKVTVKGLGGVDYHSITRTRKVVKQVTSLIPDALSSKLEAQKAIARKEARDVDVSEEERAAAKLTDEEQDELFSLTGQQLTILLRDKDGNPPPDVALDELDFEVANDIVSTLLPSGESEARPPEASTAG